MLCLKDGTNNILREHHDNLEHRDGKTHITKRARKLICNDIAMIDLDLLSYPTTHSTTDIDNQLQPVLVPCEPSDVLETNYQDRQESCCLEAERFQGCQPLSGVLPHQMGLPYNLIIDLGQNGCS